MATPTISSAFGPMVITCTWPPIRAAFTFANSSVYDSSKLPPNNINENGSSACLIVVIIRGDHFQPAEQCLPLKASTRTATTCSTSLSIK